MSERDRLNGGKNADVVIIGAGVIGLSIARGLALRGVPKVLVVERSQPGAEASSAAGGILAPQVEADRLDDFFSLPARVAICIATSRTRCRKKPALMLSWIRPELSTLVSMSGTKKSCAIVIGGKQAKD